MLVGQGARGAAAEVTQVAELLGAGVAKALLGKDVLSDELPCVTGSIGLLGTRPSYELMMDCDTLLVVGSNFPYTQFLPEVRPGARRPDRHRPDHDRAALPLRGQPRRRLAARRSQHCSRCSSARTDRSWRETVEKNVARWWEVMDRRAHVSADPVNPEQVFAELSPRLPDNAMISADSGSGTELVRPPRQDARHDARHPVREPRDDGLRRAVRHRRQVRPARTGRRSPSSATARCR